MWHIKTANWTKTKQNKTKNKKQTNKQEQLKQNETNKKQKQNKIKNKNKNNSDDNKQYFIGVMLNASSYVNIKLWEDEKEYFNFETSMVYV